VSAAVTNRWGIAAVSTLLMACLGTVYAWSYFQKPLCDSYGWTNSQVAWTFSLAICFLGLSAAAGGMLLPRIGPAPLALLGGTLFGSGFLLAALALKLHSLLFLYIGYGVIGGTGLGLGYVTPVATVAKWFPDRKGFATGMVVMGFGFGALLMSKALAPALLVLMDGSLAKAFAIMGVLFLLVTIPAAGMLRNPPPGWMPPGSIPQAEHEANPPAIEKRGERSSILSKNFVLLWLIFFCNITAGIAIIGFQSPLFQEFCSKADPRLGSAELAGYGATLIAVSSLFNGVGRFLWGWISDRIGRRTAFSLILGTQLLAFALLMQSGNVWLFALLVCYILLCYGGGFGIMPSFVLDLFGIGNMPAVYGMILTAWSAAGIAGPQMVAIFKDRFPAAEFPGTASSYSFVMASGFLAAGFLLSFLVKKRN